MNVQYALGLHRQQYVFPVAMFSVEAALLLGQSAAKSAQCAAKYSRFILHGVPMRHNASIIA